MIETVTDLARFQRENQQGDWFLHVVPLTDHHSAIAVPCILFIRNVLTGKSYYCSFNHPDSKPSVISEFQQMLLNAPNRKWALEKKAIEHMLWKSLNVLDVNALSWMQTNETMDVSEYETSAHYLVRKNAAGFDRLNAVIPLMKHKEMFEELADDVCELVKGFEPDSAFTRFNDLIIGTLGDLESQGIYVERNLFKERYKQEPVDSTGVVYSQYNVYTSTGRPSNRFGGINYAALNQNDGTRKCFVSRYGKDGCIVVLDYTTFHPRIISRLVKYDVPIDIDIYAYLAKLYFQKKEVDETDIKESKALTFRQFYGGIEDKYSHIKYLSSIKGFMAEQWELFKSQGYVLTPLFKRRITSKHISEPDPPKVFNYILQATEGELSIPKLKSVLDYLKDKKTKAVLYTYDAVMYDFYKPEGVDILREIQRIMDFDGKFPMKCYMGESYQDVRQVSLSTVD